MRRLYYRRFRPDAHKPRTRHSTVALFGPVKPSMRIAKDETIPHSILYRPTAESEETIHATQRKILSNEAMQSISVNEVLEEAEKILGKKFFPI